MQFNKIVFPYVVKGILIGLIFPLLALFICVNFLYTDNDSHTIADIHRDFPLMWIIDSAPLVLGVVSYFVGTNVNNINNKFLTEIKGVNEVLLLKNDEQKSLVKEKTVLLKEVHHRVKNNLQVVTSLLSLQGRHTDDLQTKRLFKNCQNRIKSMSMVHEMLYKYQDISKINYSDYIHKLISELVISMKGDEHNIEVVIEVPSIKLNIDTSIPLGLLVNEIITYSLKYGILGDSSGCVYFKMKKINSKRYQLLIGDDGVGYSDEVSFKNTTTLGLKLIDRLITQLKGTIEKDYNKKGTNYIVTFFEIS